MVRLARLSVTLWATIVVSTPVGAQALLPSGRETAIELVQSGGASFDPQAGTGDYIAGLLNAGPKGEATLDLVDAKGIRLRRLVASSRGPNAFHFVADRPGLLLKVTTTRPMKGTIAVTRHAASRSAPPEPPLSPAIAELTRTLAAGGSAESFWKNVVRVGTPLVEPGPDGQMVLTFLMRGARRNVRIFGSPSGDHDDMQRLPGTDIWYRSYLVPPETRLSYQLAPDVPEVAGSARERRVAILATAQADPLNRYPWPEDATDRFNQDSTVTLPAAPAQPWLNAGHAPRGTLDVLTIASEQLGNAREVTIYRPPGFDAGRPDNLLLFVFDGLEYMSKVPTPRMLDAMLAAGALPTTVAVFIANPDSDARARELPDNAAFADFLAQDLLPRILSETGLRHDPARTILAGSSFGGLAAATIAFRHPKAFGNVISLSGSFWWHRKDADPVSPNHVAALFARAPRLPLRFFISAGLFETSSPSHGDGILETSRHLRDVLLARDYSVTYRDYAGGHDYLVWRGALADGLLALFGKR